MKKLILGTTLVFVLGCAPNFAARLPIYEQCAFDAAKGGLGALRLAESLKGSPTDQAVIDGLSKVSTSDLPVTAVSSCAKALEVAKAAIKAGRASGK